ncbi:multicopper oxidase domain-containing protein [Croceicoccus sp. F390]|uniref:Multicopper oxidase domain-containing protein n=1 Tax=Croceicoccus esteveae TaxID=3075597 RepID=A0ABU2ZJ28_9SPHN|nr:multicopper oxidase domain-containing protein [Croceicoccus sp. F390]MDT0576605.1 multicopper oxidase domain-containing protein [Croceicoccus sp. F390]
MRRQDTRERLPLSSRRLTSGSAALAATARHTGEAFGTLHEDDIRMTVSRSHVISGARAGHAVTMDGILPGPKLRLLEARTVRFHVTNELDEDASVHWRDLLVFQFDSAPSVSFSGTHTCKTFTCQIPLRQAGTCWWHSHSGLQEQMVAALLIDLTWSEERRYHHEYAILLSEFMPLHPHEAMLKLKVCENCFNHTRQTATSGDMPLVERIRLRIINESAMTFFNFHFPRVMLAVIQADEQDVRDLEMDELQISVTETDDLMVEPGADAHTIVAEAMDRSGTGRVALTFAAGEQGAVPPLREPVTLAWADMGGRSMDGANAKDVNQDAHPEMPGVSHAPAPARSPAAAMDHSLTDHSKMHHRNNDQVEHMSDGSKPAAPSAVGSPPRALQGPRHAAARIYGAAAMVPARDELATRAIIALTTLMPKHLEDRNPCLWDTQGWYGCGFDKLWLTRRQVGWWRSKRRDAGPDEPRDLPVVPLAGRGPL